MPDVNSPGAEIDLSDHCLIDHREWLRQGGPKPKLTPLSLMWMTLLVADRKMHFTGLRGGLWRLLGIDRSLKNPNLCNR